MNFNRDGLIKLKVQKDFKTTERAGAGEMFQIISVEFEYENGKTISHNHIECEILFHNNQELLNYLGLEGNVEIQEV